jgi:hypothetical protein
MLLVSTGAFAQSNVVAQWTDNNQSLTVQITDVPQAAPYYAGQLWAAMVGTEMNKTLKTENVEIHCSGANEANGPFAVCTLKLAASKTSELSDGLAYNFDIRDAEALSALAGFNQSEFSLTLRDNGGFQVGGSKVASIFAVWVDKDLIK